LSISGVLTHQKFEVQEMSYLLACYNVKCVKIDFKNEEQLTETMATMSSADIKEFGYSLNDIVLDCKFAGSNCDPS